MKRWSSLTRRAGSAASILARARRHRPKTVSGWWRARHMEGEKQIERSITINVRAESVWEVLVDSRLAATVGADR